LSLRLRLSVALGALLLLAVGCSRCGGPKPVAGPADPAELAPATTQLAVKVPNLLRLGEHTRTLAQLKVVGLLASLAGLGDGAGALSELQRQVGVDFTSAEGLTAAGIDPQGTLLTTQPQAGAPLVIVSVGDAAKLQAVLARLAKEKLGAERNTETDGVTTFTGSAGSPLLAWARRGALAILSAGPGCVEAVRASLSQPVEQSLGQQATYRAFAEAQRGRDVIVYAGAQSPLAGMGVTGLRLAAGLEAHAVVVVADVPLTAAQSTALSSMSGTAGTDLAAALDPDAVLLAKTATDAATLWPVVQAVVPGQVLNQLVRAGVRINENLANFKPGAALSLSLASKPNLGRMPSFDPRETNPFAYVNLAALARVKDPALTAESLASLQKFGSVLGLTLQRRDVAKTPVYVVTYPLGEGASLALDGDRLAISGGEARMAPLLGRAPGAGPVLPPAIKPAFEAAGLAAYLDVSRAVQTLRAIPDSAYGLGGFAIKAALTRWLDAISEVKSVFFTADSVANRDVSVVHVELTAALP
jgi:hypothetical protein